MISADSPEGIEPVPAAGSAANAPAVYAPSGFGRLAYSWGYYMAFRVTFPVFLFASYIPADSAVGRGVCDGACAARDAHQRFERRAATAWNKVGDTYAHLVPRGRRPACGGYPGFDGRAETSSPHIAFLNRGEMRLLEKSISRAPRMDIQIRFPAVGQIEFESEFLFSQHDHENCHEFVRRVAYADAVECVTIETAR